MLQNVNMDRSERTTIGETLLGERIGEITGNVIGQRVLDTEEDCPKIEASILGSGKFRGIEVTEIWTYYSLHNPDVITGRYSSKLTLMHSS
jgi:hypothetical protein